MRTIHDVLTEDIRHYLVFSTTIAIRRNDYPCILCSWSAPRDRAPIFGLTAGSSIQMDCPRHKLPFLCHDDLTTLSTVPLVRHLISTSITIFVALPLANMRI